MDRLLELFFLPPMAIARFGSSPTPADSFEWREQALLHDAPGTIVVPGVSLHVAADGSVEAALPPTIVFRDHDEAGRLRPVAPFFELWAKFQSAAGGVEEKPMTPDLLAQLGASLQDLRYEVTLANRKVERRTGHASDSFVAHLVVPADDHHRRALNAFSPHTSGQEPLVFQDQPIPLGAFQVLRPTRATDAEHGVDLCVLRVRFTPPRGLVYGPPTVSTGPAQRVPTGLYEHPDTQWGRIHEIVPPERRILNEKSAWLTYIMMNGSHEDPPPQDGYDGATVGNHQAWGCVDDSSDGTIEATLVVDGRLFTATARVFVGPPDFAPDRRPVYSIADDIADRELEPVDVFDGDPRLALAEVVDIFHRAFDAATLFNLDAERARALVENASRIANLPPGSMVGVDAPKVREESMTAQDTGYADKMPAFAPMAPSRYTAATAYNPLPYTEAVPMIHGPLKNPALLLGFLARKGEIVRRLVRPPFGSFADLPSDPPNAANPGYRDARVARDRLHDMRMPPYMRDACLHPLSLSRRQYTELMDFIDLVADAATARELAAPKEPVGAPQPGDPADHVRKRVFPRNLTARMAQAADKVVGNPVTTRFDSAVGNCFPGLEFDVRELDRRFFPGLVFQFIQPPRPEYELPGATPNQQGAHLVYADWVYDPMLPETSTESWVQELITLYRRSPGGSWMGGRWYLDWIEQDDKRISMTNPQGKYYDGYTVWRIVRHLEPGKALRIGIVDRNDVTRKQVLAGVRRRYVNEAGVFDASYQPGEFTQSMCNPWTHDFRDCGCHYWATNHPDVVTRLAGDEPEEKDLRPKDPERSFVLVNWMRRRDRSPDVPAFDTMAKNRPYEIDHYEINGLWETLPFVLEGREIGAEYVPSPIDQGEPYADMKELIEQLEQKLGPLELALALQYLYAHFSLRDPREVSDEEHARWPMLRDDLSTIRQFVFTVAVAEMQHLRWVNQILWELQRLGCYPEGKTYSPVVTWIKEMPNIADTRDATVREERLTPQRLDVFIQVERPAQQMAAYGRVVATLARAMQGDARLKPVYELALRIDGEGIDHYVRFSNVRRMLDAYAPVGDDYPYLRAVQPVLDEHTIEALVLFRVILSGVSSAYSELAQDGGNAAAVEAHIGEARDRMMRLRATAEALARQNRGIPFFTEVKP